MTLEPPLLPVCSGSPRKAERRVAGAPGSFLNTKLGRWSEPQSVHVPKPPRVENHRCSTDDTGRNSHENVFVNQINEGLLFGGNLLNAIKFGLSFLVRRGGGLFTYQFVDFGFPGRCGRFLFRVPLMVFAGAQPNVHLPIRVEIRVNQAEDTGLVIESASHSLNQGGKVQGNDIDLDSHLRKVLLNHRGYLFARGVAGIGDYRKLNVIARAIFQSVVLKAEASLRQQPQGALRIVFWIFESGVEPEMRSEEHTSELQSH